MEPHLLKELGQIAGIGGIAVGTFLLLFRDVIRKKIFPRLTQGQAFRVILVFMILTWSVALAGVAAWWVSSSKATAPPPEGKLLTVAASIWKIDLDAKGALVASREFAGSAGENISSATLAEMSNWIASQFGLAEGKAVEEIRVKVQIPADLNSGPPRFTRIPSGPPVEVLLWDLRAGGKSRLPLDWESVKQMESEFQIEIRAPGSAPTLLTVTPGRGLEKEVALSPARLGIGVETFSGAGDGISERLCQQLSLNRLIRVVDPGVLETVREEVRRQNEAIRQHPERQLALRSLGVDYIISGNVRSDPMVRP